MSRWKILVSVALAAAPLVAAAQAAEPPSRCAPTYAKGWRPVPAADVAASRAPGPRPAKGETFEEASAHTCVVRLTEHDREPPKGFARNDYSRRQAFNADGSRVLVVARDGYWHLYDPKTLAYVSTVRGVAGDAEPQWHPTDPNLIYHVPNNGVGMKLLVTDVRTGDTREAADFGSRIRARWPGANAVWTRSEGSPSADGRYWAFLVDSADWKGLGLFTFDLVENHVVATYDLAKNGKGRPDHLSMSPSGKYVVVSWLDGPVSFTRDFRDPMRLQKKSEHSDLALTAGGDDAYVSIDYDASGGPLFMVNLRTGQRTTLFDTYVRRTTTALHVSGRAFQAPGWVVVSTYAEGGGAPQWLHRKVLAVELKDKPRILTLARTQGEYRKYFTAPVASVNRDFTRVLFNSNWGVDSETDVDAYLIELPVSLTR